MEKIMKMIETYHDEHSFEKSEENALKYFKMALTMFIFKTFPLTIVEEDDILYEIILTENYYGNTVVRAEAIFSDEFIGKMNQHYPEYLI